ncbi:MAG TPA: hypothetical protein VG318_10900 [Actinomycetota bacterium]|nr:hypothetical protein [Actinomycetota bacterium]
MGKRVVRALLAGTLMWAGLTACSAARTPGSLDDTVSLPAGPVRDVPAGDPVAILWDHTDDTEYLARVDPRTLDVRRELDLGRQAIRVTSFSPDGRELVMVTSRGRVRVVDLRKGADAHRFGIDAGHVVDVAWVEDDVAVVTALRGDLTTFVRIDPRRGTVLGTEELDGTAFTFDDLEGGVVALLHPGTPGEEAPGRTTVALATSGGRVASARLDEIASGFFLPEGEDSFYTRLTPGFAVAGSEATIVGTDGTIAVVDLTDMSVEIEGRDDSLFASVASWFVPPAHAKTAAGTHLEAQWVGSTHLLVTGYKVDIHRESEYVVSDTATRAGAVLLDPDDWSAKVVDPEASLAMPAGDLLLTSHELTPGDERGAGIGLRAYDASGGRVWHRFGSQYAHVVYIDERTALVRHGWDRVLVSAVDLDTGKVLKTRELPGTFPPGGRVVR